MRKLLVIFGVLLFSFSVAFAFTQGHEGEVQHHDGDRHDDHDDNAPIQAGYAVVTSASASSGMVVFETFGMRRGIESTQAGVLPPSLTTNAILFVESNGRLSKNLGVAIVNPNSSNANVTLTLRKSDGTQLGSTTLTVPARQQISKFVTELFANHATVPRDVTGTVTISSTSPVSVIGLRFRGGNFSTLPITNLSTSTSLPSIATGVGGPGAVLLPQFVAGGGWATEIIIANTGTANMVVRVDLFKKDGTPLTTALNGQTAGSFTNITVPAGGVFILAPRDADGDDDF